MVIGGVVAAVAVAGYLGVSHLMNSESAAETKAVTTSLQAVRDTQVKSDLQRASIAMESYFTDKASYPRDLATAGYPPDAATTVQVVWANGTGYCLAGGPAGKAPSWWYANLQGGLVDKPC
jgi:hypothetical protein